MLGASNGALVASIACDGADLATELVEHAQAFSTVLLAVGGLKCLVDRGSGVDAASRQAASPIRTNA